MVLDSDHFNGLSGVFTILFVSAIARFHIDFMDSTELPITVSNLLVRNWNLNDLGLYCSSSSCFIMN